MRFIVLYHFFGGVSTQNIDSFLHFLVKTQGEAGSAKGAQGGRLGRPLPHAAAGGRGRIDFRRKTICKRNYTIRT